MQQAVRDPVLQEVTFNLVTVTQPYAGRIEAIYVWDAVKATWVALWTRAAGQVATATAKVGDIAKLMVEVTNLSTVAISAIFDFTITKPSGAQVTIGLPTGTNVVVAVNETKRFQFTDLTLDQVGSYSAHIWFGYIA